MQPNTYNLVSVITINKNNGTGLLKTINSIEEQININLEWIFIDGGSTDESLDLAYGVKKNKKIISEKDKGIYDAMNKGISLISESSELTIFMNSGDYFFDSHALSYVLNYYLSKDRDPDLIFCSTLEETGYGIRNKSPRNPFYIYYGMPCHHQSIVYKTAILKNYEFDQKYKLASDYAQISKIFNEKKNIVRFKKILSVFANDGLSVSNSSKSRYEAMIVRSEVLNVPYLINIIIFSLHFFIHKIKIVSGYFDK